ncbi:MAG: hypothetical protein WBM07_12180 [Chitinivibrionales bacterium]
MAIRWMKNVMIDNVKSTIEIQMGDRKLGDKCYTRINNEIEQWFDNFSDTREDIIAQGLDILKQRLEGKTVTAPSGTPYDWQ